jgi:hypothetical protein
MGPDEADSAIDQRRDLEHALDAHAPQAQAGALALAQEADPRSGLRHGLPDRRPPPEGHAQVYSLSRAEIPSAQAPTTAAAALDGDVGEEADHQGLLQGGPPLEPARTAQAANTQHHRALPRLTARMDQSP